MKAREKNNRTNQGNHFPAFDLAAPAAPVQANGNEPATAPFVALVKRLSDAYGPSGSEQVIRELARDEIKEYVDQVRVDALGNLIAYRRGTGANRKKLMLAAALDEVGVMVTHLDAQGFARVSPLGNVRWLTALGARCKFANGVTGVFGRDQADAAPNEIEPKALFVDTGAAAEHPVVQIGDAACFATELQEQGPFLIGKALSARLGCAVIIETMRQLKKSAYDVTCVFTVQNQVGARGAGAAAFSVEPDAAIVLGFAPAGDTPHAHPSRIALSKGPVVPVKENGMITSQSTRNLLLQAAREARVGVQIEAVLNAAGTGVPVQASRDGVPTAALALPVRYEHTASEVAHVQDARSAVAILTALSSRAHNGG